MEAAALLFLVGIPAACAVMLGYPMIRFAMAAGAGLATAWVITALQSVLS